MSQRIRRREGRGGKGGSLSTYPKFQPVPRVTPLPLPVSPHKPLPPHTRSPPPSPPSPPSTPHAPLLFRPSPLTWRPCVSCGRPASPSAARELVYSTEHALYTGPCLLPLPLAPSYAKSTSCLLSLFLSFFFSSSLSLRLSSGTQ